MLPAPVGDDVVDRNGLLSAFNARVLEPPSIHGDALGDRIRACPTTRASRIKGCVWRNSEACVLGWRPARPDRSRWHLGLQRQHRVQQCLVLHSGLGQRVSGAGDSDKLRPRQLQAARDQSQRRCLVSAERDRERCRRRGMTPGAVRDGPGPGRVLDRRPVRGPGGQRGVQRIPGIRPALGGDLDTQQRGSVRRHRVGRTWKCPVAGHRSPNRRLRGIRHDAQGKGRWPHPCERSDGRPSRREYRLSGTDSCPAECLRCTDELGSEPEGACKRWHGAAELERCGVARGRSARAGNFRELHRGGGHRTR